MFNLDNEQIKQMIDLRKEGMFVIPLYVNIDGKKYGLDELDLPKKFCKSTLKIGYGCINSITDHSSIDMGFIKDHFINIEVFSYESSVIAVSDSYITFETRYTDIGYEELYYYDHSIEHDTFVEQMDSYSEMVYNRLLKAYNEYMKNFS